METITYDADGLHLITGTCIAVDDPFHMNLSPGNESFCPPKTSIND